jgi:hypothetical protein
MTIRKNKIHFRIAVLAITGFSSHAYALEWQGLLDVRAIATDSERSWTNDGLGKLRYDSSNQGVRLGQGFLRVDDDLTDTVTASVTLNAADDRQHVVDATEAWLRWNPVPTGPWKAKVKIGAFFPAMSLENDGLGWTPTRTITSSAVNSWIGDELRTKGLEVNLQRSGRSEGFPHNYGFTAAVFNGNDPAGTLMAWRGWTIGDRITGLSESIEIPDLPVYRSDGAIPRQTRDVHVFRELDNTPGYYVGANYGYGGWIEIAGMHYDNGGHPLVVKDGQYSWDTRFNHLSIRVRPGNDWELLFQGLAGSTLMGANAVHVRYQAWYALVSHPLGSGNLALRFDWFRTRESDILPSDPNGEDGHATALAYTYELSPSLTFAAEGLIVQSTRAARLLIGDAAYQSERSITTSLRWHY